MPVDDPDEHGRELFASDADSVPELSVSREAVIRGGRRRRGRRRAIITGVAAASLAGVVLAGSLLSGLGQSAQVIPASGTGGDGASQSEPGWRLLGELQGAGEAGRTDVATTDEQLDRLWSEAGLAGAPPEVDWESEVVIWFGAVWSSGAPIHLTDLIVDDDLLYPLTPTVERHSSGVADANPHAFVVALDRAALPSTVPFHVQLSEQTPSPGWPQERTVVDVDLREPGTTADDAELHDDPSLIPPVLRTVEEGDSIAVGEEVIFWFAPGECGWERLGTFDGIEWRLDDASDPPADLPPVEGDATLQREREDLIVYSIPETDLLYVPAEDDWTCSP